LGGDYPNHRSRDPWTDQIAETSPCLIVFSGAYA